jgi:hypothetical protein
LTTLDYHDLVMKDPRGTKVRFEVPGFTLSRKVELEGIILDWDHGQFLIKFGSRMEDEAWIHHPCVSIITVREEILNLQIDS